MTRSVHSASRTGSRSGRRTVSSHLHLLAALARRLNALTDLNEIVQTGLALTRELVGAPTGWITLVDRSGRFTLAVAHGLRSDLAANDAAALRWAPCRCQRMLLAGDLRQAVTVVACERLRRLARGQSPGARSRAPEFRHISIPLRAGDERLGILNLLLPWRVRRVGDPDLTALTSAGQMLGAAIHRARLYEQARAQRAAEHTTLADLSAHILAAEHPQDVMDLAVQTAAAALRAPLVGVRLADDGGRWLVLHAGCGWPADCVGTHRVPIAGRVGLSGHVFRTRTPLVVPDIRTYPHLRPRMLIARLGMRSAVAVPMVAGDRVIGTMSAASPEVGRFTADDARLLSLIANYAALALHRVDVMQSLRRRVAELDLLHAVGAASTRAPGLDETLRAIIREIKDRLGYEHLWIMLVENGRLRVRATDETTRSPILELPLGEGITGWVARHGEPVLAPDAPGDPRYVPGIPDTRSELCVPLRVDGRVIGVINAESPRPQAFSPEDLRVLTTVAGEVAVLIERTRLVDELARRVRDLSALAHASEALRGTDTQEDLAAKVTEQAARLADADVAMLCMADPDRREIEVIASWGLPDAAGRHHGVGDGISGHVLRTGHSYRCMRLESDPQVAHRDLVAGLGPAVCLPLRTTAGTVVGTVLVARALRAGSARPFDQDDERLLGTLAEIAANALARVRTHQALEESYVQLALALANAVDARDAYTAEHSRRLAELAVATGRVLGCDEATLQVLRWGALLHDIGKIAIPDAILRKPGPLTADEWDVVRRHPDVGAQIVAPVRSLQPVIPIIRHHQERWDGSGYPDGLRGDAIPLAARILAAADAYVAMTDARPYRPARSHHEAVAELRRHAGSQFDPAVIEALCRVLAEEMPPASGSVATPGPPLVRCRTGGGGMDGDRNR
ncbi:MAG: GAF domain-containing protein [Armatimonadota bacterium]|nr:GAF domain-containing protein [Armatimonadota bacterium]